MTIHILRVSQPLKVYPQKLLSHIRVRLHFLHLLIWTDKNFVLRTKSFQSSLTNALALVCRRLHLVEDTCRTSGTKHTYPYSFSWIRPWAIFFFFSSASYNSKAFRHSTEPTRAALFNFDSWRAMSFLIVASDCSISRTDPIAWILLL